MGLLDQRQQVGPHTTLGDSSRLGDPDELVENSLRVALCFEQSGGSLLLQGRLVEEEVQKVHHE